MLARMSLWKGSTPWQQQCQWRSRLVPDTKSLVVNCVVKICKTGVVQQLSSGIRSCPRDPFSWGPQHAISWQQILNQVTFKKGHSSLCLFNEGFTLLGFAWDFFRIREEQWVVFSVYPVDLWVWLRRTFSPILSLPGISCSVLKATDAKTMVLLAGWCVFSYKSLTSGFAECLEGRRGLGF